MNIQIESTLMILLSDREDVDHLNFYKGAWKRLMNTFCDGLIKVFEKIQANLSKKV